MQNIPPDLIITVKNYINITSFKMEGSPDLGQADKYISVCVLCYVFCYKYIKVYEFAVFYAM